eukprot:TRINITY_DN619_c0_g1_i1.p1 TRINITY_DN619_c0_g1~~TRINITY_DN619_c0_g1_i1.p1  ORF type:complete len:274 (+),score=20.57 TRINITY_DN619_c0_g1_i1:429-1250(+)
MKLSVSAAERRAARRAKILARGGDRLAYLQGQKKELDKSELKQQEVHKAAAVIAQAMAEPSSDDPEDTLDARSAHATESAVQSQGNAPRDTASLGTQASTEPVSATSATSGGEAPTLSSGLDALLDHTSNPLLALKREATLKKTVALQRFLIGNIISVLGALVGAGSSGNSRYPYWDIAGYELNPGMVFVLVYLVVSSTCYVYRRIQFADVHVAPANEDTDWIPAGVAGMLDHLDQGARVTLILTTFIDDLFLYLFMFILGRTVRTIAQPLGA